jgi:hypothetical protein
LKSAIKLYWSHHSAPVRSKLLDLHDARLLKIAGLQEIDVQKSAGPEEEHNSSAITPDTEDSINNYPGTLIENEPRTTTDTDSIATTQHEEANPTVKAFQQPEGPILENTSMPHRIADEIHKEIISTPVLTSHEPSLASQSEKGFGNNIDTKPEPESESDSGPPDSSKWTLELPIVPPSPHFQPGVVDGSGVFSTRDLVSATQLGASYEQLQDYLNHYATPNKHLVKSKINDLVDDFPPIFYAVATNNEWIIRLFFKHGADTNTTYGSPPISVLLYAIMHSKIIQVETSSCVATLLSLGADPSVIPKAFYSPFIEDLSPTGPAEEELGDLDDEKRRWCKSFQRRADLAATLNLTQRYHLEKSSSLEPPTERQRQVARRYGSEDIFGIPYFLIGQSAATELLTKNLLHGMLRHRGDPLVLVFAGKSLCTSLSIQIPSKVHRSQWPRKNRISASARHSSITRTPYRGLHDSQ